MCCTTMRVSLVSWLPLSACTNRVYDLWSREKLGLLQLARKVCMCTRSSDPSGCLWNLEQLHCMMATSYSAQEVTPACRSCSSSSSKFSPLLCLLRSVCIKWYPPRSSGCKTVSTCDVAHPPLFSRSKVIGTIVHGEERRSLGMRL